MSNFDRFVLIVSHRTLKIIIVEIWAELIAKSEIWAKKKLNIVKLKPWINKCSWI